jgi:hypothetical protein
MFSRLKEADVQGRYSELLRVSCGLIVCCCAFASFRCHGRSLSDVKLTAMIEVINRHL